MKILFLLTVSALLLMGLHQTEAKLEGCACPRLYKPVCAGDKTFGNSCELDCENSKRMEKGKSMLKRICYGTCNECKFE